MSDAAGQRGFLASMTQFKFEFSKFGFRRIANDNMLPCVHLFYAAKPERFKGALHLGDSLSIED